MIAGSWPFDQRLTRDDIYALRDQSGLSRQQFYVRHWVQPHPGAKERERKA
jgi:hypothetical protein